jgi:hypothetical protein
LSSTPTSPPAAAGPTPTYASVAPATKIPPHISTGELPTAIQIQPRAWKIRKAISNDSLCHDPGEKKFPSPELSDTGFPLRMPQRKQFKPEMLRRGFLFIKPTKVGGSTATGIAMRIAKNMAERLKRPYKICDGIYEHSQAALFTNRVRSQAFMWSLLREPTKRSISQFYHFQVSRQNVTPTLENFQQSEHSFQHYYARIHSSHPKNILNALEKIDGVQMMKVLNDIIHEHDFIGITERFDESMVVMQMLLDVPLGDILYLKAKSSGGYDGGGRRYGCVYIVPSNDMPEEIKNYVKSSHWKENVTLWDLELYKAVNRSLDLTIDEIGRNKFEHQLKRFRHAQEIVQTRCKDEAEYPCTPEGDRLVEHQTNCLYRDSGCGYPCLDRMAKELGLDV